MSPILDPAVALIALIVEGCFGYPGAVFRQIGHPVTWIGTLIGNLDRRFNREGDGFDHRRTAGAVTLLAVLLAAVLPALALQSAAMGLPGCIGVVVTGLLASTCLAQRSLADHVEAVREALESGGLEAGRASVSMIVGRDTAALDAAGIAGAAIESLAENFADGIVAPALFLALGGLPGGLLYKAVNTADSMIGHRTPRHLAFGWAAARVDDVVNWPAARLAALWIVAAAGLVRGASAREAWRVMRRDARGHASPNAGWPEAAMAGALGIRLGGPRSYGGEVTEDAGIGDGIAADAGTIGRALALYRLACGLNALAVLVAVLVIWLWR